MAPRGLAGVFPLLVVKTELEGMVAVALGGSDLQDRARAAFEDGHRHDDPIFLVNLGHSHLATQQSHTHRQAPSKGRTNPPARTGTQRRRSRGAASEPGVKR